MEQIEANIAVLLTVHGRKNKTLRCLENLYKQVLPNYLRLGVYLTDDGCTDGTPEAIKRQFPKVHITKGDGSLFWSRGVYRAWEEAAEQDYNFYLWSDDDSYLFSGALLTLLDDSAKCNHRVVIVAPMRSGEKGVTTYNGYGGSQETTPNGKLQGCEKFNGNCVLIPQCILKKVGSLNQTYCHAIGDIDHGCRVQKVGFKNCVATRYLDICESNSKLPARARKKIPLIRWIKDLYSSLGCAEPIPFFLSEERYIEFVAAVKHFVTIHIRVLFPRLWKQ